MRDFSSGTRDPCIPMHPGLTCEQHVVEFFPQAVLRAVKLYLPVHLLILLFSRRRSVQFFAENFTRSVLFLSLYTTVAWCVPAASLPFGGPLLPLVRLLCLF